MDGILIVRLTFGLAIGGSEFLEFLWPVIR
jgi:hypothetical protein